jgi:inorganic pyrophosphatase
MEHLDFWRALDELVRTSTLCIDRPKGTAHPRFPDFIYPLDYGYLEGTSAADGGGIDVWLGSLPERRVTGILFTVDRMKRDAEMKILIGCTPAEAQLALQTLDDGPMSAVLLMREAEPLEPG